MHYSVIKMSILHELEDKINIICYINTIKCCLLVFMNLLLVQNRINLILIYLPAERNPRRSKIGTNVVNCPDFQIFQDSSCGTTARDVKNPHIEVHIKKNKYSLNPLLLHIFAQIPLSSNHILHWWRWAVRYIATKISLRQVKVFLEV